jgi:hypothetical protein
MRGVPRRGYAQKSLRPAALVAIQGALAVSFAIESARAQETRREALSCTSDLFLLLT